MDNEERIECGLEMSARWKVAKEGNCGNYNRINKKIKPFKKEYTTLINIDALNQGSPKYIKQLPTELKGKTNKNTIMFGNNNTPLTVLDSSFK